MSSRRKERTKERYISSQIIGWGGGGFLRNDFCSTGIRQRGKGGEGGEPIIWKLQVQKKGEGKREA